MQPYRLLQGMGKVKEALKDAEQCIMYNGAWDKGYTRKGAALLRSGDRTNANCIDSLERAMTRTCR